MSNSMEYTYAVARIRAKETTLFSGAVIEQLLGCKSYEEAIRFLKEKGWGSAEADETAESLLAAEREKTWEIIRELAPDLSVFDVLSYSKEFHNLKAAIKEACSTEKALTANLYYEDASLKREALLELIREKAFGDLPESMAAAAEEAYTTLLHTRDGQLCDVILDRAALEAILAAGKDADDAIIREYAESTVAIADIKIAVRAQKTGKSLEFMKRALAPCETLSVDSLARAAVSGDAALRDYLSGTDYAEGAQAVAQSPSAFERWCDNRIIRTIAPQKYNSFSVGPLFAYLLARENEIKTVRIILTGKLNEMPEASIRERVRDMYV